MGWRDLFRRPGASRPLASGTRADGIGGGWTNVNMGLGGGIDRDAETIFCPAIPLDPTTVDSLIEFQAIARRIVSRESDDATREGYKITGIDPGLAKAIVEHAEDPDGLATLAQIGVARKWARAYGGGAVVGMLDDAQDASLPLDPANLRAVRSLVTCDRHELPVQRWGVNPNNRRTFGRPLIYSLGGEVGRGETIHASRVLPFQGNSLPRRIQRTRGGYGGSVLDLVWSDLVHYGVTNEYTMRLVTRLTQGVFASQNLGGEMAADGPDAVVERMEAVRIAQGVMGDIVIDKEAEDYTLHQRTLAGLKDAIEGVTSALVAATDIPRTILLGETPGGINSGEQAAEIRAWYDHVATLQANLYQPLLSRALRWIMLSKEGPTRGVEPDGWEIEWLPLWQMSEQEQEVVHETRAKRRSLDILSAVISPDEARRERALVDLYQHDPTAPAPAPPAALIEPGVDADDESANAPIPVADPDALPPPDDQLTTSEAAARLRVSTATVHAMAREGEIRAWRVRNRWRFSQSEITQSAQLTERPAL